jgi:hypothetical protein
MPKRRPRRRGRRGQAREDLDDWVKTYRAPRVRMCWLCAHPKAAADARYLRVEHGKTITAVADFLRAKHRFTKSSRQVYYHELEHGWGDDE